MGLDGEIVAAVGVSSGDGAFRLIEELADLRYQLLLARGESLACDLIQIFFGGTGELFGGALIGGLFGGGLSF